MNFPKLLLPIVFLFTISRTVKSQDCNSVADSLMWEFNIVSSPLQIGDNFFIECNVKNFTNIVSFQYTLNFDPQVLAFIELNELGSPLVGPIEINDTPGPLSLGRIGCIWTNGDGLEQSVDDGPIFKVFFKVIGDPGDCSFFEINSSQIDLEIYWALPDGSSCVETDNINQQLNGNLCVECSDELNIVTSGCDNEIEVQICGGEPPFMYSFEGPPGLQETGIIQENELLFTSLENGSYLIVINDSNGTSVSEFVDVTDSPQPIITGSNLCIGESIVLSTEDFYTDYLWSGPNGYIAPNNTGPWATNVTEAGIYSVEVFNDDCSTVVEYTVEAIEPPSVTIQNSIVCNTSVLDDPTILDFSQLIMSNAPYTITDPSNTILTDLAVDFDGFAPGSYVYLVEVEATAPCIGLIYEIIISVIDCACPPINLFGNETFCNDTNNTINFFDYLGPGSINDGSFCVTDAAGNLLSNQPDSSGIFNIDQNFASGVYTLTYKIDSAPIDCPDSAQTSFEVVDSAQPVITFPEPICNSDSLGNATTINLDELATGASGIWYIQYGDALTSNLLDFNGVIPQTINLVFEPFTSAPCEFVSYIVPIEVIDCFTDATKEIIESSISIFPNPTSEYIQISTTETWDHYRILNSTGTQVDTGTSNTDIDISTLKPGVYLLTLQSKHKKTVQASRFIKVE